MEANSPVDLARLVKEAGSTGPLWGTQTEDLNCTFLLWTRGQGVAAHTNEEVDVVMVVLDGEGELTLDGETEPLAAGRVVVLLKGTQREIRVSGDRLAYLNVHKRRRGLMPVDPSLRPR